MGTLHCALENGSDLHVNERQKIQHYRARSTEERSRRKKEECQMAIFFYFVRCVRKLRYYIAMLYTHSIGNQP